MKLRALSLSVQRADKEVLRGIDFSVDSGEVYALLGGNGAGKSTTLLTFLGFLSPSSGDVQVDGQSVAQNILEARKAIAYLPESASLYEYLNAYENLDYFLKLADLSISSDRIDEALDQVSLPVAARHKKLHTYSKGMRQKVSIALAILRSTNILLLDEPTSGLDPTAIDEFHSLVRRLADEGKSILMVTHDVYGACHVADRIGLLKSGKLVGEFSAPDQGPIDTETVHRAFSTSMNSISNDAQTDTVTEATT
jgi:ABC-2 type transport system ATP-binding protein